jgi:hypothetical protein
MGTLTVCGICTYHAAAQRWLRTLRTYYDGPCRLYLVNSADHIRNYLSSKFRCDVVGIQANPDYWAPESPGRYCRMWGCLSDLCREQISTPFVLRTDVWDVVFQGDPRDHLDPAPSKILFASESVALNDDSQNKRWLGPWSRLVPDGVVVNGGMICGTTSSISVLAKLIACNPFGTAYDQSELTLLQNVFNELFEYRPGFMETIYNTFHTRGAIEEGVFVDRLTRRRWCVIHGNGSTKHVLDEHCPITDSDRAVD